MQFFSLHVGAGQIDRQYTRLIAVFPHKRPTVYKRRHGKIVATHPKRWVLHI